MTPIKALVIFFCFSLSAETIVLTTDKKFKVNIKKQGVEYLINVSLPDYCRRGGKLKEIRMDIEGLISVSIDAKKSFKIHESLLKKCSIYLLYEEELEKEDLEKGHSVHLDSYSYRLFPYHYLLSKPKKIPKEELDILE